MLSFNRLTNCHKWTDQKRGRRWNLVKYLKNEVAELKGNKEEAIDDFVQERDKVYNENYELRKVWVDWILVH